MHEQEVKNIRKWMAMAQEIADDVDCNVATAYSSYGELLVDSLDYVMGTYAKIDEVKALYSFIKVKNRYDLCLAIVASLRAGAFDAPAA